MRRSFEAVATSSDELIPFDEEPAWMWADMSSGSKATSIKRRAPRRRPRGFVLCVKNDGYEASLERRKLYATIPDRQAAANGQIRVIDESGEDYLFPSALFVAVELPATVRLALA